MKENKFYLDYLPVYNVSGAPQGSFNIIGRRSNLIIIIFISFIIKIEGGNRNGRDS